MTIKHKTSLTTEDIFDRRISALENEVKRLENEKILTAPGYDSTNFPPQPVHGQIALAQTTSASGIVPRVWTARISPWDLTGYINSFAWSDELGIWIAAGSSKGSGEMRQFMSSTDGITWTDGDSPFSDPIATNGAANIVVWVPSLSLFVSSGEHFGVGTQHVIVTSTDGLTWTVQTAPLGAIGSQGLAWSEFQGKFVCSITGTTDKIMTSPDGVTWTAQAFTTVSFDQIIYQTDLDLWVGFNGGGSGPTIYTSPDGVTWTAQFSPFDASGGFGDDIIWSPTANLFIASGNDSTGTYLIMTSPDAVTWTNQGGTPIDGAGGNNWGNGLLDAGGLILCGVTNEDDDTGPALISSIDGITWVVETDVLLTNEGGFGGYSPGLNMLIWSVVNNYDVTPPTILETAPYTP